MMQEL